MALIHGLHFNNLRGDIFGGVTAAVIALPLALAFGVASGAGPMAGLYGAIFVGLFAAIFGGTPSQISGPTGPMTVVMASIFVEFSGEPALAFTVVMLGGALQIVFGMMRFGQLISLVPFTVISGFMSGIGCIIIILQIAPLLGQATPAGGPLGTMTHLGEILGHINPSAAVLGLGTLAFVWFYPAKFSRYVPAPLVALVIGTLLVVFVLTGVPVLGEIPTGLPDIVLPQLSVSRLSEMLGSAFVLALLGAIDSLLTSLIADSVTRTEHKSNRELIGQGIGNMIAGLFGAIPGAGATMRTVVNVRAGGRTPISGVIHGVMLLGIVLGLAPLAENIPHAVLAGILFKVGIDIIDWRYLAKVKSAPRQGVLLMGVVLVLTVFVDLILAVGVGMTLASLMFVKRMARLHQENFRTLDHGLDHVNLTAKERDFLERYRQAVVYYHLSGPVSFGAAKDVVRRLVLGENARALILDLSEVNDIDTSGSFALEDVITKGLERHLEVYVSGTSPRIRKILDGLGVLSGLHPDHIVETRAQAMVKIEEQGL